MKTIATIIFVLLTPLMYKIMVETLKLNEIGSLLAILLAIGVGLTLAMKNENTDIKK